MTRFHYGSTQDDDLLYLTGYYISDPFFFLEHNGTKYVFLSILDVDAFRDGSRKEVEAVDLQHVPKREGARHPDPLIARAFDILDAYGVEGPMHVSTSFPLHLADALREAGMDIQVSAPWCPERTIKTGEEIEAMHDIARSTVQAFEKVEEILKTAVIEGDEIHYNDTILTSEMLKYEIEKLLLKENAVCEVGLIVSCGAHSALPHHSGEGLLRPHELIIVDIFPRSRVSYYFSDMTRTYVKGTPSEDTQRMYDAVAESQRRAREALGPGVACKDVFNISAEVIRDAGFDVGERGYIHSLGHGVGVSVHETPSLSPRSQDVLKEGNVVTVEPGLYYEKDGGVRIEDTVLITKDGYEVLTEHDAPFVIE